jgi:hypothetical protein
MNGLMSFWRVFTAEYTKSEGHSTTFQKDAMFLSKLIKFVTTSLFLATLSCIPSYFLGGCQFHPFAFMMSPCYGDYALPWYAGIPFSITMAVCYFFWCFYEGASAMILFLIGCTSVVFSQSAWKQLE